MTRYQKALELSNHQFKRLTGVKKQTANLMCELLQAAYDGKHKRRGRHTKLAVEDIMMMMLEYLRQYTTFLEIGMSYGIAESSAYTQIVWAENVLIKSGKFSLKGKKFSSEVREESGYN